MKLGVFVYDFPHCRSNDFLVEIQKQHNIEIALAAPYKLLNLPKPSYKVSMGGTSVHPRTVCDVLKIPSKVIPHEQSAEEIKKLKLDIGIIAGARILPENVIKAFKIGVINFHPGILPQNRGLDTMRWAIYNNLPQGVTVHWIDKRIDAGYQITSKIIDIKIKDSMPTISYKLHLAQLDLLSTLLHNYNISEKIDVSNYKWHTMMNKEEEKETLKRFKKYKEEYKK